eukprot:CAMPEP_0197721008 /NCGR_PEP_ID=MMETSP1434-20131217/4194_1 /TAXON_ID=265543 /ORGANISM="Minutocellus polymorphus, Strain CCMP3303" /LENGTH=194 /DNA_ID=CAMNT_0043305947 /DNA_START=39 /DNA_END=623 /DNA_ORIENTATION=-
MPRRPLACGSLSLAVIGIFAVCGSTGTDAFVTSLASKSHQGELCRRRRNNQNSGFVGNVPVPNARLLLDMMRDSRGDSGGPSSVRKKYSAAELERLREAARCPEAFERLSLNMKSESSDGCCDDGGVKSEEVKSEEVTPTNKAKGYQRIEDWDADQKKRKDGSMTWEEKLMFDGQRHGNQVRQNDILIRNLHAW